MPALDSQVKQIVQDTIGNNAKRLANANDYIDADKLIALAAQLNVTASNAQAGQMPETCQAQVAIAIPENLLKQAQTNAPLLQSEAPLDIINQHLTGSNSTFSNHTLSFPLNYAVKNNQFTPTDNNLSGAANLLADALAAYGVKDTLNINGKNVSRAEALKLLKQKDQPKAEEASMPAPQAVQPAINLAQNELTLPEPALVSNASHVYVSLKSLQEAMTAESLFRQVAWHDASPFAKEPGVMVLGLDNDYWRNLSALLNHAEADSAQVKQDVI